MRQERPRRKAHRAPSARIDTVGRPDIDQFAAVMYREDLAKGFVVAFSYTSDALRDIDRFLPPERQGHHRPDRH